MGLDHVYSLPCNFRIWPLIDARQPHLDVICHPDDTGHTLDGGFGLVFVGETVDEPRERHDAFFCRNPNIGRIEVRIPLELFPDVAFNFTVRFHGGLRLRDRVQRDFSGLRPMPSLGAMTAVNISIFCGQVADRFAISDLPAPRTRIKTALYSAATLNAMTIVNLSSFFSPDLQQKIKDGESTLPVSGFGTLQLGIDDFETSGKRNAQPSRNLWKLRLGLLAVGEVERGTRTQVIEDRLQVDLLIHLPKRMNAFVQALGDRQVPGLNDTAAVGLRRYLPAHEQVVKLVID